MTKIRIFPDSKNLFSIPTYSGQGSHNIKHGIPITDRPISFFERYQGRETISMTCKKDSKKVINRNRLHNRLRTYHTIYLNISRCI